MTACLTCLAPPTRSERTVKNQMGYGAAIQCLTDLRVAMLRNLSVLTLTASESDSFPPPIPPPPWSHDTAGMDQMTHFPSQLRNRIPTQPSDVKLTKVETLRLAMSYISHLEKLVREINKEGGTTMVNIKKSLASAVTATDPTWLKKVAHVVQLVSHTPHSDNIHDETISNDSSILNVSAMMCLISRAISPNKGRLEGSACQHRHIKPNMSSSNSTNLSGLPPLTTKSCKWKNVCERSRGKTEGTKVFSVLELVGIGTKINHMTKNGYAQS
eukprot:sb/3468148/